MALFASSLRAARSLVKLPKQARCFSGVTGRLPGDSEQATGLRKDELDEEVQGHERFNRSMLWVPSIGTKDDPTMIPSALSSRIVGCVGGCTADAPTWLRWFVVEGGDKATVCPDCGQHFKLDPEAAARPLGEA